MTAELSACSDMPLVEYDESEEWTLEDDDIIQARLVYSSSSVISAGVIHRELHLCGHHDVNKKQVWKSFSASVYLLCFGRSYYR